MDESLYSGREFDDYTRAEKLLADALEMSKDNPFGDPMPEQD